MGFFFQFCQFFICKFNEVIDFRIVALNFFVYHRYDLFLMFLGLLDWYSIGTLYGNRYIEFLLSSGNKLWKMEDHFWEPMADLQNVTIINNRHSVYIQTSIFNLWCFELWIHHSYWRLIFANLMATKKSFAVWKYNFDFSFGTHLISSVISDPSRGFHTIDQWNMDKNTNFKSLPIF